MNIFCRKEQSYTEKKYNDLLGHIQKRLTHVKFGLSVYNTSTKINTTVSDSGSCKLDNQNIVFDPEHKSKALNHPDSYYCSSFSELKEILKYMIKNLDIYVTNSKDIMDTQFCVLVDTKEIEKICYDIDCLF